MPATLTISPIRRSYDAERARLRSDFEAHGRVSTYLRRHANVIDRQVSACARISHLPTECAVVALGGYGRGEMFPYSDIDVLVLTPPMRSEPLTAAISAFVAELWNLGLTVGSSVRTPAELAEDAPRDLTLATAFLEARLVTGSKTLFADAQERFAAAFDVRTFFHSKVFEMRQRHAKHEDTPYALEPNIKEHPGGLRDLQVLSWCLKAAGFGSTWKDLAAAGIITETESFHLTQCEHFLSELRIRLHLLAGRHEDRLLFDLQPALSEAAGCKASGDLSPSEQLMKQYYLNAKDVVQLNAILLQAYSDRLFGDEVARIAPEVLDDVFLTRGDILDITDEDALLRNPGAVLRTFALFAEHRELKRFSTQLLRALWHSRYRINADFRNDPANKALFLHMIQDPAGPYHCLKNMNTWGILGRFLPVFRRIVGQMQHDLFHAYTVDQHTLRVVKYLRRFQQSKYAHEFPLCSQVISELPDPWRLTIAGLFHDIAKGRGGNHSELGARDVRQFAQSFKLSTADTDFIEFLVAEHLTMSRVAQKEDISDPGVVQRFAARVGTRERLDALFLLTVADIRATSPKVWNSWKQHLLELLYESTLAALKNTRTPASRATVFAERRAAACDLVDRAGVPAHERDALWRELNLVYFLRHTPEDILWHTTELASVATSPVPVVRVRRASMESSFEVLLYTHDEKDLFARVVAFFERERLSVLDARIHTTRHGWALDTFLVQDRDGDPDLEYIMRTVVDHLSKTLLTAAPLAAPVPGRLSRRSRNFPVLPVVEIEHDEVHRSWLLEISCSDRLGLLSAIAYVLAQHNVNLQTAKISTLDERAEDVFLIDGQGLDDPESVVHLENDLLTALKNAS